MFFVSRFLFVFSLFLINTVAQTQSSDINTTTVKPADESAVKSVVIQYFNALSKKDISGTSSLWSEKSPDFSGHKQELEKLFAENETITLKDLSFRKTDVDDDKAKVRVFAEITAIESKTKKASPAFGSSNHFLYLVRESGNWRISRQIPAEKELALRLIAIKNKDERSQTLSHEPELINIDLVKEFYDESARLPEQTPYLELLDLFSFGAALAEKVGYQRMTSNFLNKIAEVYDRENQPEKALEYLRKSYAVGEEAGDKFIMANALGRTGNLYNQRGNTLKALEYHQKALPLREEIGDPEGMSIVLSNLGMVSLFQANYTQAIDYFERSIKASESVGEKFGMAIDLYNLGNVYKFKGDYAKAMDVYQKSLSLAKETKEPGIIGAVANNIAGLYNTQGNYEQAIKYINIVGEKFGPNSTYFLNGLGGAYSLQGQYLKAIEYYEQALVLKQKSGDKPGVVENLTRIGNNYLLLGDSLKASEYFQQALELTESSSDDSGYFAEKAADVLLSVAKIQITQEKFGEAQKSVERARSYYAKFPELQERWELYAAAGQINQRMNQPQQARRNIDKAIELIEKQRLAIVGSEIDKQQFFGGKVSAYRLMIDLLISQNNLPEAQAYAERAKSRALLDVLQNGKVDYVKTMTVSEKEQERRLKNELVSLNAQISKENKRNQPDKNLLTDLENQLQMKRLEFEDFQTRLYAAHPELRVQRGEMKPVSVEDAAKLLPDNKTALLEFVVADDKTFLFVITKDAMQKTSLKAYSINIKKKDLAEKIENFRGKLSKGDLDFQKQAQDLYNMFVKPAESQLKGKTNLIIVPDASLWDLPFQALQNLPNKYLIEQTSVSYAPSLTTLREMAKKNKGKQFTGATLLAFGNPTVGQETSERVKQVFMSEKLDPLPEAERLVNSLKQMYGPENSRIFTGSEAREEIAKREAPKYRIVQFAAHGILNDISPMYSHIVLAQKADNPDEDGLLEAWEMKDLNLNAEMVILSACETARGRVSGGEGVIGMSWALFIAGAPTTVASQWKVESSSTTELMLEFHRQLLSGKGISKAEALRRASLKLLKTQKYKHPSYWAGFVMVGDGF